MHRLRKMFVFYFTFLMIAFQKPVFARGHNRRPSAHRWPQRHRMPQRLLTPRLPSLRRWKEKSAGRNSFFAFELRRKKRLFEGKRCLRQVPHFEVEKGLDGEERRSWRGWLGLRQVQFLCVS